MKRFNHLRCVSEDDDECWWAQAALPEPVAPPAAERGGATSSSSASLGRLWAGRPPLRQSPGGHIWRNGPPEGGKEASVTPENKWQWHTWSTALVLKWQRAFPFCVKEELDLLLNTVCIHIFLLQHPPYLTSLRGWIKLSIHPSILIFLFQVGTINTVPACWQKQTKLKVLNIHCDGWMDYYH